jgi:hypothetical protein
MSNDLLDLPALLESWKLTLRAERKATSTVKRLYSDKLSGTSLANNDPASRLSWTTHAKATPSSSLVLIGLAATLPK